MLPSPQCTLFVVCALVSLVQGSAIKGYQYSYQREEPRSIKISSTNNLDRQQSSRAGQHHASPIYESIKPQSNVPVLESTKRLYNEELLRRQQQHNNPAVKSPVAVEENRQYEASVVAESSPPVAVPESVKPAVVEQNAPVVPVDVQKTPEQPVAAVKSELVPPASVRSVPTKEEPAYVAAPPIVVPVEQALVAAPNVAAVVVPQESAPVPVQEPVVKVNEAVVPLKAPVVQVVPQQQPVSVPEVMPSVVLANVPEKQESPVLPQSSVPVIEPAVVAPQSAPVVSAPVIPQVAQPVVPVLQQPVQQVSPVIMKSAEEALLIKKEDYADAPIEVPAPDPGLVLSEPIDSTTKLLIDLDEHVQKFLPVEEQQQPQPNMNQNLVAGIDYSPSAAVDQPVVPVASSKGLSNAPLSPYSGNDDPIVPPLPSLVGVEQASPAAAVVAAAPSLGSSSPSSSTSSSSATRQSQSQNQQQVINQLLDQLDALQARIQDTINQLVARRRYVLSAVLRPMGTYVRRVRANLERLQNRVSALQAAATSMGGGNNRPGGFVDAAAIETIRRRIDDISKRISDIINRIRFSLTPTSAPLNNGK